MTEVPTAIEEQALVHRAKAGEFAAFEELVNRHERRLYNLAMYIVRNPSDAQDVVQTAFTTAVEKLDGFREEASFGTWITRIATNAALKVLRRRRVRAETSLDEATEPDEDGLVHHPDYIADWRDEPSMAVERLELRRLLDEAVDGLPEKYRLVFVLRDLQGLSTRATAEALGLTEANVKVRLLRARLALRERLTRRFGDPTTQRHRDHGDAATAASDLLRSYQLTERASV